MASNRPSADATRSARQASHRPGRWTVDELARTAGTTTRQIRALQTQGLLPRPDLVGRTGYYDVGHLERLRAIERLQADGFSLAALATLLRGWEANMTLAQVLGLGSPTGGAQSSGEDDSDAFGDLAGPVGHAPRPRGRILSLVPSTILDQAVAS
jgi:DNA-binding transcriptional MerR regulator